MMKKNKTLHRILALLLMLVLAVGLVACGNQEKDSDPKKEENNQNSQGNTNDSDKNDSDNNSETTNTPADTKTDSGVLAAKTDVTAEDILAKDFSDKIKISFAGIQVTDGLDYNHGNDYYSWWTDTFNVEWDVTSLTFENWIERMNIWINADDLPDWSVWNFNPGDAANYVDQGLIKELPADWKEKYPNLAAAASCTAANAYYENLYGGTYFLFRPVFANNFPEEADTITSHISVVIRKDWADQANYDLSKNLESNSITFTEFMDYLQAIKDAGIAEYPWYNTAGGVGQALDRCTQASGIMQSAYYKSSDGQYHWGPAEEETGIKEGLRKIKAAYDNGLLYPEFYTLQDPDDLGHFYASGDCAANMHSGMAAYFDRYDTQMQTNLGISYWDTSVALVLTDDDGVAHETPSTNYWACNIISPNIDDETLDRILTIWDYGCTEEGQLRIRLGIPDVDWKYDENGEIVSTVTETGFANLEEKYTSLYPITGNMFILSDDYSFISPAFTKQARDRVAELYITRSNLASSRGKEPDWNLLSYSSQAMNLASMTYADEYANIITKPGDFDANYDQWVADKLKMIQPVLDELNAAFAE